MATTLEVYTHATVIAEREAGGLLDEQLFPSVPKNEEGNSTAAAMASPTNRSSRIKWRAQGDDFRTFLGDFVSSLTCCPELSWIMSRQIAMRQKLAEWLNQYGNAASDAGKLRGAERLYKLASTLAPQWSVPWYNLGLLTKNTGRWEDSLIFDQRALSLNPGDEGACWNLGIAATAMHDWPEARRAWKHYGIDISDGVGEVMTAPVSACVRLNPRGSATDLCSVLPRIGR